MRLFVYGTCRKSRIHRAKAARAVDGRTCFYVDPPKPCRLHQRSLSRKLASIRS